MLDIQDAISLLEKRESRQAVRLLEQMVDEMPGYATARVLLARSYEALEEWDRALAVWREAMHLIPNSPVIRRGLERAAARPGGRSRSRRDVDDESPPFAAPAPDRAEAPPTSAPPSVPPTRKGEAPPQPQPPQPGKREASPSPESQPGGQEAPQPRPPRPQAPQPEEAPSPFGPPGEEEEPSSNVPPPARDEPEPQARGDSPRTPARDEQQAPPVRRQDIPPPTHIPPERDMPDALDIPDDLSELEEVEDTGTPHYEDLDRLINELESARIVPRPDLENVPPPDLEDDIEDVVSETLARIYASQGQYDEAARVYELLAGQHPDDADDYLHKASQMRSRASDGE